MHKKGKLLKWEDGERRVGKGTSWKVRLLEGGANARKVGMVGKLEFFFVM
jgi:hypothetical protein